MAAGPRGALVAVAPAQRASDGLTCGRAILDSNKTMMACQKKMPCNSGLFLACLLSIQMRATIRLAVVPTPFLFFFLFFSFYFFDPLCRCISTASPELLAILEE